MGLEVVAATCGSLLFWHGNGISIWWLVSTKIQQPRNTDPTRWVTLYTPLGPCIHDSVAIGSLVDLGQDLHGYIQYTIYCKWNVRLLNACGLRWILNCDFDTGLCTKRCSKKFLKFKELSARVIACWGFCKDFDVCVAILPCDCWATLYGCYTSICWFIGYSFVEL